MEQNKEQSVLKSSLIIAVWTMLSRFFGLARDILLAIVLGATPAADIFVVAFRLPNLFRRLFAEGAFAAAFIPTYMQVDERKNFSAIILSWISIFLFLLTLLSEIFMEEVVFLLAGGFVVDDEKFALTVLCSRITFPYLIFMFLTALYGAMLNAAGRFVASAAVPILLNIVLIIASLYIWQLSGGQNKAVILSISVAIAGIVQAFMMIVAASRVQLFVLPKKIIINENVKHFLALLLPALAAGGVVQINIIIGTRIASSASGAVAQLYYAERLYQLPLAVIGIAMGSALLPALSGIINDRKKVQTTLAKTLEGSWFLTLPAAFSLALIANPIIAALFEYGAFSSSTRIETAMVLTAFAVGLPAFVLLRILSVVFFAHHNMKAPFYSAFVALVINASLALWWFELWGASAVALATSIAAWVNVFLLWTLAVSKNWLLPNPLYRKFASLAVPSMIMAVILYYVQVFYPLPLEQLARIFYLIGLVILGLIVYFSLCHILGIFNIQKIKKEFL